MQEGGFSDIHSVRLDESQIQDTADRIDITRVEKSVNNSVMVDEK